jgi:hypothetical protein
MSKEQNKLNPDVPAPSNAFMQVLQTHDGGEVLNELADAQRQCLEAVALTGKAASVTLTLKYTPAAKGAFAVAFGEPKVKLPAMERPASLWFGDENGQLTRNDPRQKELPLKTVADPAQQEARKVG